ncbi:hypothetical protein BDZ97DRAFT_1819948, partial [Flammula alnicola]
RSHFFITGLSFWAPQAKLTERFVQARTEPLNFGLAKPDLVEIKRTGDSVQWRVIDAKASKQVKTSHHIQIYFYTLCLTYLLRPPFFRVADSAGIWLPPKDGFQATPPSIDNIKAISISLLAPALDAFLFRELPKVIALPSERVKWHYNPLCRGCRYEPECRTRAQDEGRLGSMPNISIDDAGALKDLLRISFVSALPNRDESLSDIEELHELVANPAKLEDIARSSPTVVKKAKQILSLPKRVRMKKGAAQSPIVEAARTHEIQIIPRRNYTCPSREDIAVIVSIVNDPSSPNLGGDYFCITPYSENPSIKLPSSILCPANEVIAKLATLIRSLAASGIYTSQFYVWSSAEQALLQSHIINAALTSSADDNDIRLCIGALAEGASLLQTTFQPLLLSGALLSFLGKGRKTKEEYKACLTRMGLSTEGPTEVLRKRIDNEVRRMQDESAAHPGYEERRKEFGQLPRVVPLKKEIERQLALPIPGYWDLPECVSALLPSEGVCPSDEQIFTAYKRLKYGKSLHDLLVRRNWLIFSILKDFRARAVSVTGHSLLVNGGKIPSTKFMDICREPHTRKLFFMQQFEVLAKLTELWQSRIDGCPEAPTLEYCNVVQGVNGPEYIFRLLSGTIDVPATDRDYAFYDKLLVLDTPDLSSNEESCENLPVEALFDDLGVSGLVFPLNRYTKASWGQQDPRVQRELVVADVRNVYTDQEKRGTMVALRTWGNWQVLLKAGAVYRLSSRLVDFNTTKILSALFEIDLRWSSEADMYEDEDNGPHDVPFLQLIINPTSFGKIPSAKKYVKAENDIQKLFRDLKGLGNNVAGSLVLKASQHRATQRILSNRLSVIWGPPGTGKTYTISLSLLRLLEVERRHCGPIPKIIFITAITHAAIEACQSKLLRLMDAYRSIDSLPHKWLDEVEVEVVSRGNDHPAPPKSGSGLRIYAGTIYQLSNFTKRNSMEVDCVIIDEAGQMSLGGISLVLRSLSDQGRIIIAGDSEQLAPILSAKYPQLKFSALFGSVLDSLMFSQLSSRASLGDKARPPSPSPADESEFQASQSTVVQLTENFRLNPDLGEFVSTIYSRRFKPQKVQARQLAAALKTLASDDGKQLRIQPHISKAVQTFLVALSDVMFKQPQTVLVAPEVHSITPAKLLGGTSDVSLTHRPVSLALIRLRSWSAHTQHIGYELHVHGEAAVAAALAVKAALGRIKLQSNVASLEDGFRRMHIGAGASNSKVTVDTIERLQGSEAAFVICLFSLPRTFTSDLGFLLERRRLNVAISRAKTLCILISSDEVLCPSVKVLANEETAKDTPF